MDWTAKLQQLLATATPLIQRGALGEATETIQQTLGAWTTRQPEREPGLADGARRGGMPPKRAWQRAAQRDALVEDIDFVERPEARGPREAAAAPAQGQFQRIAFAARPDAPQDHYWLYVPAGAAAPGQAPRPLVLMLHGCTQDPQDFATGTGMNAAAEAANALVLYPAQSRRANPKACWNWFRPQDQQRDVGEPATLVAMVCEVMAQQRVDGRRIYVAGLSAGGAMAALLGREYPELFAAVGVHSGLQAGAAHTVMGALSAMKNGAKAGVAERSGGHPTGPLPPLIVFHGDADRTVDARNAQQLVEAALAGQPSVQRVYSGVSPAGQRYTRTVHRLGNASTAGASPVVEQWMLHGAGHAWAGGDARASHTDPQGVSATQQMLRFFLAHPGAARH